MDQYLHIVSFNVPLPANYGGVIDVFYKIKALHQQGVKVILHCFLYDRNENPDLDKYCEKVYYYQRKRNLKYFLSTKPYIVITREDDDLLNCLSSDHYPVLFEGLHSAAWVNHPLLKHKKKLIRIHNVEHQYYQLLAQEESNIFKKLYFKLEALKLKSFEKKLQNTQHFLVLSNYDAQYYAQLYASVHLIPPFHQYEALKIEEVVGDYILFNADFNVSINYKFAKELNKWARQANKKLILAGKVDFEHFEDISIFQNPTETALDHLVANAFVNIVSSDHPSGFKLKLVHALYRSKNIVVVGKYLKEFTEIACPQLKFISSLNELSKSIQQIEEEQSSMEQILTNRLKAFHYFNNIKQAKHIISFL
ncbi:hypothetical protein [Pedobacter cryophilus]|uniref:Mannosyltransferase n=1 Tax=Pedobacter cryophilus TaxID=2571271 RepID=A0A4U1BX83_9SPHI|nr:hypothetical protein [Pedobacter cryophilus]TKB95906.1 hypothetical protein FA046_14620 [Pedobacter cryophilus]